MSGLRADVLDRFAEVLDYPGPELAETVSSCVAEIAGEQTEAAELLRGFLALVEATPLGRLQEIYTGTFDLDTLSDLDATCYPYVGHHLFGESYKRSTFLLGLKERYRAHGFAVERELPDHLVVMLRFCASCRDESLVDELVHEALVPALTRMVGDEDEPILQPGGKAAYLRVLRALLLVLRERERLSGELERASEAV